MATGYFFSFLFVIFLSTFENWIHPQSHTMNSEVVIRDKVFELYISHEEILKQVKRVATQITKDYQGKTPLFLAILNGSFFFASDLLKNIDLLCEISFVKLASYVNFDSTGHVKELIGLTSPVSGKDIIILEDIVDTGKTMKSLLQQIRQHYPESIRVATLLFKKEALIEDIKPDYVAVEVPNKFLIGYGLDYNQYGRNLKDIYTLKQR